MKRTVVGYVCAPKTILSLSLYEKWASKHFPKTILNLFYQLVNFSAFFSHFFSSSLSVGPVPSPKTQTTSVTHRPTRHRVSSFIALRPEMINREKNHNWRSGGAMATATVARISKWREKKTHEHAVMKMGKSKVTRNDAETTKTISGEREKNNGKSSRSSDAVI